MQSLTIFKPDTNREYKENELKNIKTSRKEIINDNEENLEFQLFFNEKIGNYIRCHIRMEEPFAIEGRIGEQEISEVIITSTYEAFLNFEDGTFLVLANKESAEIINNQFHNYYKISSKKHIIDLQDIISESTNVKRTQFRRLAIETINGSSLSGNNVNDTELYRIMLDAGELSAIAVTYPFDGDDVSFSISDSGSIVIFSAMTNEEILIFIKQLLEDMENI
ncbi:hypothetical protein [Parvimonas micra]